MPPPDPRSEFLMPGKNGMETSVAIREVVRGFSGVKRTMEREKVKEIFRRLNEGGVRYALIGGLACAEYAPPRATEDVDIVVLAEDTSKVRQLFPGCYQRGTAIVGIYDFEGTRLDVQTAKRRSQVEAIRHAVDASFEAEPVKIVTLRDLVFLKLWASCERPELGKKRQDETDVTVLLEHNSERVSAADVASIARNLLGMACTSEETERYRRAVDWLNRTLDLLGLEDRKFTPGD